MAKINPIYCPYGKKNDGRTGYPKPPELGKEANKVRIWIKNKHYDELMISSTPHDDNRIETIKGVKTSHGFIEIYQRNPQGRICEIDTVTNKIIFDNQVSKSDPRCKELIKQFKLIVM